MQGDGQGRGERPARAEVRSFLDRDREVVLARGRFEALDDAYLTHAKALGPLPGEAGLELMRQALACACLQLALLPRDQFIAWTFNLHRPPLNVFLAGDNHEFQVTGRIYSERVRPTEVNRLYVEIQRPRHEPARSVVDFSGLDVPKIFERYFESSAQIPTRLFALDAYEFLIIQGLPRVDRGWLAGLDAGAGRALADRSLEPVERRAYAFACGCDPQKILAVLRGMFQAAPEALFEGAPQIQTACPRCGRTWIVTRQEFDAARGELGFS